MAIAIGQERPTGIQPGRGGFMRSIDGKPYVTDPTGATTKHDGNKPELLALCAERGIEVPAKVTVAQLHELLGGRPKRLPYGSPSNRGMQIENSTNLVKWGERRVVLGVGLDPEIAQMCTGLTGLDVDSDEYKTLADAIIVRAKEVAKANLAAQQGTHVHALTEDFDEERDWVRRAEAGEILGLNAGLQAALVDGWNRMLKRFQLEVLAVEASCVDDAWHLAGTLDRIVRLGMPLRFTKVTGEIAEIPAGTVVVLDVKTSNKRLDRQGCVQFWQAYAIQIASYAQSVPYDTAAETRGVWPFEIDQTHALIAHPDIETAEWELIYCDLEAGREHGGACVVAAKAWEARNDVFSVAQLDVPVEEAEPSGPVIRAFTGAVIVDHWLIRELAAIVSDDAVAATAGESDAPIGSPAKLASGQVLPTSPARAEPAKPFSVLDPARLAYVPPPELAIDRDEGSTVHLDEAFNELNAIHKGLDPAPRAWLKSLIEQAMWADVSFHAHGNRTERRYWIIKGLLMLCIAGLAEDEVLRALVAIAMDSDTPLFAAIHPGYALGALGASGAQTFAGLVDQVNDGRLTGRIDGSGVFVFTPAA